MAAPAPSAPLMKRPVGRPRKIPRTKEEEEEFKRRQMKAMAQRAVRAQMVRADASSDEDYMDDDDDDFDDYDLEDEDDDSDTSVLEMIKQSKARVTSSYGRPRVPSARMQPALPAKQNKSLMCKPIMLTKATSCNPIRVGKSTQSEFGDPDEKKIFLPVPFPMIAPTPLIFNVAPAPYPTPLPLPFILPHLTSLNKEAIDVALKQLQELHDSLPPDEEGMTPDVKDNEKLAEVLRRLQVAVQSSEGAAPAQHNNQLSVDESVTSEVKPEKSEAELARDDGGCGQAEPVDEENNKEEGREELKEEVGENMMEEGKEDVAAVDDAKMQTTTTKEAHIPDSQELEKQVEPAPNMVENSLKQPDHDQSQQQQDQDNDEAQKVVISSERLLLMQKIKKQSALMTQKLGIVPPISVRQVPVDDAQMRLKYSYGVNAYRQWATKKNAELDAAWKELCQKDSDSIPPFKPVKRELLRCSPSELSFYLASFVNEFSKPSGEQYACDSLFYFCVGIRYYLYENGRLDDIFHDEGYREFIEALNSKLLDFQLRLNNQGLIVCRVTEEHLWESNCLGVQSPYSLIETLIYLNTKNFLLLTAESHLGLSFSNVMKQWKKNAIPSDGKPARTVYLKYNPLSTLQAAVEKKSRVDPNMLYEQLENVESPLRCPVKLYEFYLSKCPESIKHRNDVFYLQPEPSCIPSSPVWFSAVPLDHATLSTIITRVKAVREVQESLLSQRAAVITSAGPTTSIHHTLANGQTYLLA